MKNAIIMAGALLLACALCGCSGDSRPAPQDDDASDADAPISDAVESDGRDAMYADASGGIELSPALCDDPRNLQLVAASLADNEAGGGGLEMNEDEMRALLENPTDRFYMVNLIRFRERAEYADGRETDLTGREANALYDPLPLMTAIGGRVVYNASVDRQIDGADDVEWDDVAIVEYPCPIAFLAMSTHPDFQATVIHKDAGVETTRVLFAALRPMQAPADPDQSEAAYPPKSEDPAFDLMHVMDFHDIAQYEPGVDEPERTGREAWEAYQAGGTGASAELGHYPTAFFEVRGTLIGENTSWDEVQIVHMSSQAGFDALLDDETRQDGRYHRYAALADNDSVIMYPRISAIPYADGDPGGGSPLEVTDDGVGTLCTSDDDCPGDGVDTCLTDGSAAGFCTREGCGPGECQSPYLCCRECADAMAGRLPFDGSACLPEAAVAQLAAAPISCTCD